MHNLESLWIEMSPELLQMMSKKSPSLTSQQNRRWMLMEAAAGLAYIPCTFPGNMDAVQHTFSIAAESGFTVARVFAHGVNSTLALQMSPGGYLDFPSAMHIPGSSKSTNPSVVLLIPRHQVSEVF